MSGPPTTTKYRLTGRDGIVDTFDGIVLGCDTSYDEGKMRWVDVAIYRDENVSEFVVHIIGRTVVENEIDRSRVIRTPSAFVVVEVLTAAPGKGRAMYIPRQNARALAQAAKWNDDIRDAYVNRAVT